MLVRPHMIAVYFDWDEDTYSSHFFLMALLCTWDELALQILPFLAVFFFSK